MFSKSWRQIQNTKAFKEMDAELDAMLESKTVSYTADLCKHENFSALCPWCKPKWWQGKPIKNPIKTSHGLILILNHLLTLIIFGILIAYYLR